MLPQQTHQNNYSPSNYLRFKPRTECERFHTRTVHTAPEENAYEQMRHRSQNGKFIKRYQLVKLLEKSGYKDKRTMSRAINGLLDKGSIEFISDVGRNRYGTEYRFKTKEEIWHLRQTPEWQERQAGKSRAKKALTVLMVLRSIKLIRLARKGQFPSPLNTPIEGAGGAGNLPSGGTFEAPTDPVENDGKILLVISFFNSLIFHFLIHQFSK